MNGQMSIFDFPDYLPEGKEKRLSEIKKENEGDVISPAQQYYIETGKNDYWQKAGQKIDQESKEEFSFKCFNEHCRHRGWYRGETEDSKATWMCCFVDRKPAKSWDDWQPCTLQNCPLVKE